LKFEVRPEQAGDYLLYVAHLRQSTNSGSFTIPFTTQVPSIDGDAADWTDAAATLASDTARQFLRGGGIWQGPDVDSHQVRLQWDENGLYLLASVRDPEHVQEFTLSNVWQGDSVWLYFTAAPDARTLDSKFTLSQTPDGPQIWDWKRTEFAEGGQLAWSQQEGGYTYEVFLPWATVGLEGEPAPGTRIGIEAGRGFGGSAFMDLTGRDPDIAANLLQLTLVRGDEGAAAAATPNVALGVRVDRGETVIVPQSVAPDSDYFWLDLVTAEPVRLDVGEHTLRYEYAGEVGSVTLGLSKVDAFYLQPATGARTFVLPDGRQFTLTYNTLSGESTWGETP
ncbi:MAG TPA: sugar-binding protein, partial [Candidatus Limnocylindrales bacterium]|nr:sugar-binding protein [Candidatus Limnocylindrales bacterium]